MNYLQALDANQEKRKQEDRETAALRASHAEMLACLKALLGDEWRVSCDWGPASEREPITEAARAAIANGEACK